MFEVKQDAKTKKRYLLWVDNFGSYVVKELKNDAKTVSIDAGNGTGTTAFL